MQCTVRPDQIVLSNAHVDTTRAHVAARGGTPVDLVGTGCGASVRSIHSRATSIDKLQAGLERHHQRVAFIIITITNNLACSSPVSMANIRAVRRLADVHGVPVYFDACRMAENAYFIKEREVGYEQRSIAEIIREMLSHGQGCWMSAKKDALVNVGRFLALADERLARRCQEQLVLYEGFPSYGGRLGATSRPSPCGRVRGLTRTTCAIAPGLSRISARWWKPPG